MTRSVIGLVLALGFTTACGEAPPPVPFEFGVEVASDGDPVEGATLLVGGQSGGVTDEAGRLSISLPGEEGQTVAMSVRCPSRYRDPEAQSVQLRRLGRLGAGEEQRSVRVRFECHPEVRLAMLLVRASMADLPVLIDGREVARTDTDGLAHIELERTPRTSFDTVLGTSAYPELLPQNPSRTFVVPDSDELFVFDQRFETPVQEQRRRRRRRRAGPTGPSLPIRITRDGRRGIR